MQKFVSAGLFTLMLGCAQQPATTQVSSSLGLDRIPNNLPLPNPSGFAATYNVNDDDVDLTGDFFTSFGTNGRVCGTCHTPTDGWSVIPQHIQDRFFLTGGTDPIFRPVDGANSPNLDFSTFEARLQSYSMLLTHGVIRVGIGIGNNGTVPSDFDLVAVDDPFNFASSAQLSLFRRPLQSSNLPFLSTVMFDGRETLTDPAVNGVCPTGDNTLRPPFALKCFEPVIPNDLMHQALDATLGHAQAMVPGLTTAQQTAISNFESGLSFAQIIDYSAGRLDSHGAIGGPDAIPGFTAYFGQNDNFGDYETGAPFTSVIFNLYNAWAADDHGYGDNGRDAIARGQAIFNTKPITITGVGGLNGVLGLPASFTGSCGTCHNQPEAGNHSVPAPLNIGTADPTNPLVMYDGLPIYTLQCNATGAANGHCTLGAQQQVTDPGRALITGAWADIAKFKGPTLRGIAARAPYFHNGSQPDLGHVVDFYNNRFNIGFTDQERSDLIAFLQAL